MSKILIVEDDYILSKAINTALQTAGYETKIASDGEEAMEKMRAEKFDLILLDLLLPKRLGEEVLAEMKQDEDLKDVPVLVATVKSDSESIARCTALGIRGYFIKAHYTLEEIVERVRKELAQ